MKCLAFDTSGELCSIALLVDGEILVREEVVGNRHTERLLPLLAELCAEAGLTSSQLDGVAFGAGPGAFTGVRIAASAAHGIALAHDLPVVAVSSLAALALGGWRHTRIPRQLATLDARRGELYWGLYRVDPITELVHEVSADKVGAPDTIKIPPEFDPWAALGRGWEAHAAALTSRLSPLAVDIGQCRFPHATEVAHLGAAKLLTGHGTAPEMALPIYLRAPV
ncbi:MAG: tRNA (adenosine(37)-N6)-threonylcarbamoyltransferase complex dimerization subunit type 1 TsaB [Gammaproteobacteria bacterium]|nr:tRNA (adenosine(37)-N6)-threonylcarbamoyltransferase complex dimerization subunit type 1 TsaB [Gammaproteobacteria bacterium]